MFAADAHVDSSSKCVRHTLLASKHREAEVVWDRLSWEHRVTAPSRSSHRSCLLQLHFLNPRASVALRLPGTRALPAWGPRDVSARRAGGRVWFRERPSLGGPRRPHASCGSDVGAFVRCEDTRCARPLARGLASPLGGAPRHPGVGAAPLRLSHALHVWTRGLPPRVCPSQPLGPLLGAVTAAAGRGAGACVGPAASSSPSGRVCTQVCQDSPAPPRLRAPRARLSPESQRPWVGRSQTAGPR